MNVTADMIPDEYKHTWSIRQDLHNVDNTCRIAYKVIDSDRPKCGGTAFYVSGQMRIRGGQVVGSPLRHEEQPEGDDLPPAQHAVACPDRFEAIEI
jgi:hypothetical protein